MTGMPSPPSTRRETIRLRLPRRRLTATVIGSRCRAPRGEQHDRRQHERAAEQLDRRERLAEHERGERDRHRRLDGEEDARGGGTDALEPGVRGPDREDGAHERDRDDPAQRGRRERGRGTRPRPPRPIVVTTPAPVVTSAESTSGSSFPSSRSETSRKHA